MTISVAHTPTIFISTKFRHAIIYLVPIADFNHFPSIHQCAHLSLSA
jgi:hypothetical protein